MKFISENLMDLQCQGEAKGDCCDQLGINANKNSKNAIREKSDDTEQNKSKIFDEVVCTRK